MSKLTVTLSHLASITKEICTSAKYKVESYGWEPKVLTEKEVIDYYSRQAKLWNRDHKYIAPNKLVDIPETLQDAIDFAENIGDKVTRLK